MADTGVSYIRCFGGRGSEIRRLGFSACGIRVQPTGPEQNLNRRLMVIQKLPITLASLEVESCIETIESLRNVGRAYPMTAGTALRLLKAKFRTIHVSETGAMSPAEAGLDAQIARLLRGAASPENYSQLCMPGGGCA